MKIESTKINSENIWFEVEKAFIFLAPFPLILLRYILFRKSIVVFFYNASILIII